jgi:hypothetical protein
VRGAEVVGTTLVSGVDGRATAADVVPLLVAEVPLAGWGWEGYVTGIVVKVQEVRDLMAQEDCRSESDKRWQRHEGPEMKLNYL